MVSGDRCYGAMDQLVSKPSQGFAMRRPLVTESGGADMAIAGEAGLRDAMASRPRPFHQRFATPEAKQS